MKKSTIILVAVVAAVLSICVFGCSNYNGLVTSEQEVDQAWADVQNQYQRRFDLIPNLVETVKGYAAHEKETFQGVTDARSGISPIDTTGVMQAANAAMNAPDANAYASAMRELKSQFSIYVNAVHEAYPDLKANEQFLSLQDQLEGTENRIATYRGKYTEAVKNYNLKVKRFPGNIFAGIFGFEPKTQFEAEADAQTAPKVKF